MLILSIGSCIKIIKMCHVTKGWEIFSLKKDRSRNYEGYQEKTLSIIYSLYRIEAAVTLCCCQDELLTPWLPALPRMLQQPRPFHRVLCIPEPSFGGSFLSSTCQKAANTARKGMSNNVFYKAFAILFKPVCQWLPRVCLILQLIHAVMKIS